MLGTILLVAAFICFLLAAAMVGHPRINLVALGLACATLTLILARSI